jgi:CheY-like chemotaxis protein
MTEPLALVLYEKVLPGSQLVNWLQDMRYRVQAVTSADVFLGEAERCKPIIALVDLHSGENKAVDAIRLLRHNPSTAHVPVIAFCVRLEPRLEAEARDAGATLVVTEAAITNHLAQLLEQALTQF